MFQTISDITRGPTYLQKPIDNRGGCLRVGLRSITFTVGWYNILKDEYVHLSDRSIVSLVNTDVFGKIYPGLWTFEQLENYLKVTFKDLTLSLDEVTGRANVIPTKGDIKITEGLLQILGFERTHGPFKAGQAEVGQRPVNFSPNRLLFVHLEQLNTVKNVLNGAPSSLLAVVAVGGWAYGDIKWYVFPNPEFKLLRQGTISELSLTIKDERGNVIDNHGLPVSVDLEVK